MISISKDNKILFIFFIFSVFLTICTVFFIPFLKSTPINYLYAQEFIETGKIASSFLPVGYTTFLAIAMKLGGDNAIIFFQALVYILIVITPYFFIRSLKAPKYLITITFFLFALHPYFLFNIVRIVDTNLTTLFLLLFYLGIIYFSSEKGLAVKSYIVSLALGSFFAFLFLIRPNTLLLGIIPVILYLRYRIFSFQEGIKGLILFFITFFIIIAFVNFFTRDEILFFPKNGGYNFFVGSNKYSFDAILNHYTGESSIVEFQRKNPGLLIEKNNTLYWDNPLYWNIGIAYVAQYPHLYLRDGILKFFTLFRPDYREVDTNVGILKYSRFILQTIIALPIIIWLYIFVKNQENIFPYHNTIFFLFVFLYILPFIITTSDPRYRLPLDTLFIIDGILRLSQRKKITKSNIQYSVYENTYIR